jgi:hypothetical protein
MPVSFEFAQSNRSQTERLRRLVQRLDTAMLTVRLPNGWTVARTPYRQPKKSMPCCWKCPTKWSQPRWLAPTRRTWIAARIARATSTG